ncbi:hypothetical protein BDV96DRAFT_639873 [Lophiotrema nucula]|uniref:BTB domain-containing protein n=1 Tax=Lophiotrema nucula TaxID=690887 RepID=A0A6A5ZSF4_9PLEO|nr:hypothetical protein BDV96DRAFT_639873 [Lophiotrema nucula]
MEADLRVDASAATAAAVTFGSNIIKVSVGEKSQTFNVHEAVLCASSQFFKNACKEEWASLRPDRNSLSLSHDDPADFEVYVYWLYYGKLPTSRNAKPSEEENAKLFRSYVLGEQLLDVRFKNAVMTALIATCCHKPNRERVYFTPKDVSTIWSGTPPGSPIRKLILDAVAWVAHNGLERGWMGTIKACSKEVLVEFMEAVLNLRKGPTGERPWENEQSLYMEKEA